MMKNICIVIICSLLIFALSFWSIDIFNSRANANTAGVTFKVHVDLKGDINVSSSPSGIGEVSLFQGEVAIEEGEENISHEGFSGEEFTVSVEKLDDTYDFIGWRLNGLLVSNDESYNFTLSNDPSTIDSNLVAHFSLKKYPVTVSRTPVGGGSVKGSGLYEHGSNAILQAIPSTGYRFIEWVDMTSNEKVSQNTTHTVKILGPRDFRASFLLKSYKINLSKVGQGSVSGGGTFSHGILVNISAQPEEGYDFIRWEEDGAEISHLSSISFIASGDRNIFAIFAESHGDTAKVSIEGEYNISASSGDNGNIEPQGNISVYGGASKTFKFLPDKGYGIFDVIVDGESVGRISEYPFEFITSNHAIHVDFEKIVKVSPMSADGGSLLSDFENMDLLLGDELIITQDDILVNSGYDFVSLLITYSNGDVLEIFPEDLPYTYIVSEDVSIALNFINQETSTFLEDSSTKILDSDSYYTKAIEGIRNLKLNDEVISLSNTIVGSVALPLSLVALLSTQFGMYYYALQFVFGALGVLGIKKRLESVGNSVVYNSVTKEPIKGAIVRIYNKLGKLISTDVTNIYGYFSHKLPVGEYKLKVFAERFNFPSSVVKSKDDPPYGNIYKGENISIKASQSLEYSIPIDPISVDKVKYAKAILINRLISYLAILQKALIAFGFLLATLAYIRVSSLFNLIIFLIYIPFLLLMVLSIFGKLRKGKYGSVKVSDSSIKVSDIELGLEEVEFNQLVAKRICDSSGKYRFVVPAGKYRLVILNKGYEIIGETLFDSKKKPVVLDKNISVQKKVS